jgi:hypothetical protein
MRIGYLAPLPAEHRGRPLPCGAEKAPGRNM